MQRPLMHAPQSLHDKDMVHVLLTELSRVPLKTQRLSEM